MVHQSIMARFVETALSLRLQRQAIDRSIWPVIRDTYRVFRRAQADRLRVHNVTQSQWAFLRVLCVEDGLHQREVARRVGIHPTTAVPAVEALVRDGLVKREPSPKDRRLSLLFLTEKAQAVALDILPFAADLNARATSGLTKPQTEMLQEMLKLMQRNLLGDDVIETPPPSELD